MSSSLFGVDEILNANQSGTIVPQSFSGLAGQVLFTLTSFTYTTNTSSLEVYINGNLQISGRDYQETSSTSFTLNEGVQAGDFVDVFGVAAFTPTAVTPGSVLLGGTYTLANYLSDNYINVKNYPYLAKGDGTADDTAALIAADAAATLLGKGIFLPAGTYNVTASITRHCSWTGETAGSTYNTDNKTKINKINGNTGGNKVLISGAPNIGCYFISLVVTNPPVYYLAAYPTGLPYDTTNPDYGFYGIGQSSQFFFGCTAAGFRLAGIDLEAGCIVSQIELCDFRWNGQGAIVNSTDCQIISTSLHHNQGQGMFGSGAFLRMENNRVEWNGAEGVSVTAPEIVITGNTFDRNAKAGVYANGGFGCVITGNYFNRNGAGGDGSVGRWAFATVAGGAASGYVVLAAGESCHIRLNNMRGCTIGVNRYHNGLSDTNDGSNSPAYILNVNNSSEVKWMGNASENPNINGAGGYNPAYPGGAVGFLYGTMPSGSFTANKEFILTKYGQIPNNGAGGTLVVPITQDETFGSFLVKWATFPNAGTTRVRYYYSATFGSFVTKSDETGTGASGALTLAISAAGVTVGGYTFLNVCDHNCNQF